MFDDLLLNAVKKIFNIQDIKPIAHYDSDSSSDEDLPPKKKRTKKSFKKPKCLSDSESDDDTFSKKPAYKKYTKPKCVSDDDDKPKKCVNKPFKCSNSDSDDDTPNKCVKKTTKCDSDSENDVEDAFFKKLAKQHKKDHTKKLNSVYTKKACSDTNSVADNCCVKPISPPSLKTNWYCVELSNFKPYTAKTTNPNTEYLTYAYDAVNAPYTFDMSSSFNEFFTKNNKAIRISKTGNYKIKGICYNDISTAVPGQENNTIIQSLFLFRNQKTSMFFNVRDYDNINASSDTILASSDDELEFKLKFKTADIPANFKIKLFISPTI